MTDIFISLQYCTHLWCYSAVNYSGSGDTCWIGLYKSASSTSYYWLDGNNSTYRNWHDGEPGNNRRQCVVTYYGKFSDIGCIGGRRYRYVCKGIYLLQTLFAVNVMLGSQWSKQESWAIAKTTVRCAQYNGCREKFRESWLRPRLLFRKFLMGFCSDRY